MTIDHFKVLLGVLTDEELIRVAYRLRRAKFIETGELLLEELERREEAENQKDSSRLHTRR